MEEAEAIKTLKKDTKQKMLKTLEVLKAELGGIRSGRVSPDLLKGVSVDYYGVSNALMQIASVNVMDAHALLVTPYDPSACKAVEKAINESNLGLNASIDANTIRVPVPALTEERRKSLVRHVRKIAEDSKVSIRHIRREANEHLKQLDKQKLISQDQNIAGINQIQDVTDQFVKEAELLLQQKEKELTTF